MAALVVTLEPDDVSTQHVNDFTSTPSAHVYLGRGATLVVHDPDQLEKLAEVCMEAARDLRIVHQHELNAAGKQAALDAELDPFANEVLV